MPVSIDKYLDITFAANCGPAPREIPASPRAGIDGIFGRVNKLAGLGIEVAAPGKLPIAPVGGVNVEIGTFTLDDVTGADICGICGDLIGELSAGT